jgi:ABC-type nitrate/sulfonate/bicarbonate transport system substrate-binding protein
MLRAGGTATLIGLIPEGQTIELLGTDFLDEKRIQGSSMGSNRFPIDIPRYVDFYLAGKLKLDELISTRIGLDDVNAGYEALKRGEVAAISLMEPWISVAEKQGLRVLMESHSTRSEAAGDELDGPTLAKMFRAEAAAAEAIESNPEKFAHYLVAEAGGLLQMEDLKLERILNAPPEPYTRERFDHTYQWTLGWGLVPPGATYENTVDNRAWQ